MEKATRGQKGNTYAGVLAAWLMRPDLIGSVSDMTDRKQAEEVMQMNAANFRNLTERTPDAVLIVSEESLHVYANQHASDQLGYSVVELLQTQLS